MRTMTFGATHYFIGRLSRVAPESVGDTEIYDLKFEANAFQDSEPHRYRLYGKLTVFSGALSITSDGVTETIGKGDSIRYVADRPHSNHAKSRKAITVLIVSGS